MDRRGFLAGAAAAAASPGVAGTQPTRRRRDGLLEFAPDAGSMVDFRRFVPHPVTVASAEILVVDRRHQFVRVTSREGDEGVVKANARMEEVTSLFHQLAKPAFVGADARDAEAILNALYRKEYKFAGLAFWTAVGHLELALWDMLGRAASRRCVDFMGPVLREQIPVYVSSLDRNSTPEAEADAVEKAAAATGARGCKIKVGGRMSRNADAAPGRSEGVVAAVRKRMGDAFTIYADANGSYDAPRAIELCRMLEDHGVAMLEEPCPFEEAEMTRQVTQGVRIPIAGGEQDSWMPRWRWYIENKGLDVIQPDFMYNGGMLRTLVVQRMAAKAGVGIAPHYPRNGAETVELLHFAAQASNLYGLQEYRLRPRTLDFAHAPVIAPKDGMLTLPPGPGFGIEYDPSLWPKAARL